MVILPASIEEICLIISETKTTNSAGIDGFLVKHFKAAKFNSAILISKLINKIVECDTWPNKLKTQIVRPIYKKGKKHDLDNYRPISLLPVLNKFIEKFFAERITTFLTKKNLLSENQFGFRKNKSTNDALKEINDKISGALNDGKFVSAIMIDLQKAFDTVNHDILLNKCAKIGLRGKINNILNSYLKNRKMTTRISNTNSTLTDVWSTSGVCTGPIIVSNLY